MILLSFIKLETNAVMEVVSRPREDREDTTTSLHAQTLLQYDDYVSIDASDPEPTLVQTGILCPRERGKVYCD